MSDDKTDWVTFTAEESRKHIMPTFNEIAAHPITRMLEWNQPKGGSVLDAGCNFGYSIPYIEGAGCEYFGIDQSEFAVEILNQKFPGRKTLVTLIQNLNISDPFDAIVCKSVLQHNNHYTKKIMLEKLYGSLRDGGTLITKDGIFTEENVPLGFQYNTFMTDGWSFTLRGWIKFMREEAEFHFQEVLDGYMVFKKIE